MAVTLGFKKPPPGGTDYMPTPPVPPGGTDAGAAPAAPAGGNFMTPENINQGLANLNFGQAPPPVPVPTIAPVPGLGGPPPPPPPGPAPPGPWAASLRGSCPPAPAPRPDKPRLRWRLPRVRSWPPGGRARRAGLRILGGF